MLHGDAVHAHDPSRRHPPVQDLAGHSAPGLHQGGAPFGIEVVVAPTHPDTTQVDVEFVREAITDDTIVIIGSAGNYPYGTIDPIGSLSELAVARGVGLHVDGCLGGWILPGARTSATRTSRCSPGATPPTASTTTTCAPAGRAAPAPRRVSPAAAATNSTSTTSTTSVPLSVGIYGGGGAGRTDPAVIGAFFRQVMDAITDGAA